MELSVATNTRLWSNSGIRVFTIERNACLLEIDGITFLSFDKIPTREKITLDRFGRIGAT